MNTITLEELARLFVTDATTIRAALDDESIFKLADGTYDEAEAANAVRERLNRWPMIFGGDGGTVEVTQ